MGFFSDILGTVAKVGGGLLGGLVGGPVGASIGSSLGGLLGGAIGGSGSSTGVAGAINSLFGNNSTDAASTAIFQDLYNQAKQGVGLQPYANTVISPTNVNYQGVATPPQVTPGTYSPGNLNLQQIPQIQQLIERGYTPAQAQAALQGQVSTYNPSQVNASQIDGTAEYQNTLMKAAQLGPAALYQAAQMNPTMMDKIATTNPELYQAVMLGSPEQVQQNLDLRSKQDAMLGQLQNQANKGFDATDQMGVNQVLNSEAQQSTRQQQAITDNLRQRGISSGGMEAALRMQADQANAQNGQANAYNILKDQQDRKATALQNAAGLAGNLQAADTNVSAQNAAAKNQFSVDNQNAANSAGQYNATAKNNSNQFNATAANNMNQFNANANNAASQANMNAVNQSNQFNAGALNNNNLANAQFQQTANQTNANSANQANQFNAGQLNNTAQANAQFGQQANLANQSANNQAGQYNSTANNSQQQFNAGQNQQVNLANMGAQNTSNQYNATAANAQNQYNVGANNTWLGDNTNIANQGALAQFNANNSANQFNINNSLDASKYNVGTGMTTNQFNATQNNNMSRDNAGIDNNMAINNRDYLYNVTNQENNNAFKQFQDQLSAANAYGSVLNANQAAKMQQLYAQQMGMQNGTGVGGLTGMLGNALGINMGGNSQYQNTTGNYGYNSGGYTDPFGMGGVLDTSPFSFSYSNGQPVTSDPTTDWMNNLMNVDSSDPNAWLYGGGNIFGFGS